MRSEYNHQEKLSYDPIMSSYSDLCSPLLDITGAPNVSICQNREQALTDFLQNALPPSDTKRIPDELRKTFTFCKFKVKRKRKADCSGTSLSIRKKSKRHLAKSLFNARPKKQLKYTEICPLRQLWLSYMRELLDVTSFASIPGSPEDPNWETVNQQLMRADYHGASVTIRKSKCASLVGLAGIVVLDTKKTFKICGTDDCIRTIPKDLVVICIHLDDGVTVEVHGKYLGVRPVERAVRKFRIR